MSSNADGSIPSYLYDLDAAEAAELFAACIPQDTDKERSVVETAEQGNRARAGIPSYLYHLVAKKRPTTRVRHGAGY